MRKKIIVISVMMAFLAIFCVKSAAAQIDVTIHAWTDRRQYEAGETGTLYITVRNDLPDTDLIIKNITIIYENWYAYLKDHWEGNNTFTDINQICGKKGGVYNKEVTFTVPTDGRGVTTYADISITTDKLLPLTKSVSIHVVGPPVMIEDMDLWMTSLTVTVVVCTIILAIVVFLSTRGARASRVIAPAPPKAKAA